jgi:proline iminopeptidase
MENYINVDNSEIWTIINDDIDNSKPFLCLCGGGPGIGDSLFQVDNLIKINFNIIRFEQRGCGRSSKDGNYLIETVISDLEEIRKFYNIKKWYVGGHSWGAGVALFYGLKYQYACNGIIYKWNWYPE